MNRSLLSVSVTTSGPSKCTYTFKEGEKNTFGMICGRLRTTDFLFRLLEHYIVKNSLVFSNNLCL